MDSNLHLYISVFDSVDSVHKGLIKISRMNKYLRILLVILVSLSGLQAKAGHLAAADIYYEYMSPLTYKVHLVLYQDCGPASSFALSNPESVTVSSASCGQSFNLVVDTVGNGGKDTLSSLCAVVSNWCKDPNSIYPAYERWHFSGVVTLPMACTDWEFEYNTCCRNNAINNLVTPSAQGLCVKAGLNNVARPINSSAQLTVDPIPYVCVNQLNMYLNGPFDIDVDSLVFTSIIPKDDFNCAPLTYSGTNSLINPLPVTPVGAAGFVTDPSSGTVVYTPTQQGVYVLAFQADDYDYATGVRVGYTQRDVQLNVLNCNSAPPAITQVSSSPIQNLCPSALLLSTSPTVITVCPGAQVCFDVSATSQTVSNLVLTSANNTVTCPGSTYTSTPLAGGNPVTGHFSWVPTGSDIGDHILILTFTDSTCAVGQPLVLKTYQVIQIKVLQGVDAGPDLITCIGADSVQLNGTGPITVTQWTWSDISGGPAVGLSDPNIANPMAYPPSTTTYVLNTNAQTACKNADTVVVNIVPGITVSAGGNHTICANDSVQLMATANPAQVNPIIDWTPGNDLSDSTAMQPWASPLVTTAYELYYIDDNGCKYTDTAIVDVNGARPILNALSSETSVCPGYPFQLFANASSQPCGLSVFPCTGPVTVKTVGTENIQDNQYSPYFTYWYDAYKTQMLFTAEELKQAGIVSGNISKIAWNVISKGSDTMRNLRISIGCTSETSLNGTTGFLTGLTEVKFLTKYYSTLGWNTHTFNNNYFWDGVSNLVVQLCYDVNGFSTNNDVVACSNTLNTQFMHQNQFNGTGCNLTATTPIIAAVRPNTRFTNCETGSFDYSWTPSGSLTTPTSKDPYSSGVYNTTDFVVTVSAPSNTNCASKDTIQVVVDNSNSITASASPQVICQPGYVTLTGTPAGSPPVYDCGEENVTCSGLYNTFQAGNGVASNTVLTPFYGAYAGGRSQMLFTAAELNALGITKGKIQSIAFDLTTKTSTAGFNMSIKMGCTPLAQLTDFIPISQMKLVYQNPNYNTVSGINTFPLNTEFVWDGVKNLVVEICFYNGQNNTNGSGDAVMYSNTANPQFYTQNSNFGGCELPSAQSPSVPISSTARPNILFSLCDIPNKTWKFRWNPANFVYDSTAGVTTAYVNGITTYHVYTTGGNKCEVTDSVTVTLSQHDLKVRPMDTTICEGDTYQALATGIGNAPSQSFLWYDEFGGSAGLSCTNCPDPYITLTTPGIHYYTCVRTDSYNCGDTVTIKVNSNPKPNVTILNGDSIKIKYEQEVNLIATGASIYNWTPVWGTSNPNMPNTIVSPAEPTQYYVYGLNQFGCRNMDSIYVDIDYHDNLFIPTAFTPNGDGKNDIFRIGNLTFQKVQEFRILNRWGQEVFSATDNRGWNGFFKGKPQDAATFYYLIRVAYPDGATKMFKGDVILVR